MPEKEKNKTSSPLNMKGFTTNIEKSTKENNDYRKVLYTSQHMQLVLMSLKPNEEIGEEVHEDNDQFFRFESGHGICKINEQTYKVTDGDVVIIPAGAKHNIINTDSASELKVYTIYTPPVHKDGITLPTKKDEETREVKFDGKTTE
jgi:mannose-6-phosphate isomerase-like protein (cupin superfamily)